MRDCWQQHFVFLLWAQHQFVWLCCDFNAIYIFRQFLHAFPYSIQQWSQNPLFTSLLPANIKSRWLSVEIIESSIFKTTSKIIWFVNCLQHGFNTQFSITVCIPQYHHLFCTISSTKIIAPNFVHTLPKYIPFRLVCILYTQVRHESLQ